MPNNKPFVVIVVDHDKQHFSVEGPMLDDELLNDLVCDAQQEGRQVNCHTPGGDARGKVEVAAESYQGSFPNLKRVAAGSIV